MANALHSQDDGVGGSIFTTAVAIDRDKNSQYAVKWAVENLHLNRNIILVHVKNQYSSSSRMFSYSLANLIICILNKMFFGFNTHSIVNMNSHFYFYFLKKIMNFYV